jgi:dTDP-4-dehydrorhamnose 3,5-epimerase
VNFRALPLPGAFVLEQTPAKDERGHFARLYCAREYEEHGLNPRVVQSSLSSNLVRGTLRGMHYQAAPHEEAKTIRCIRGAVFDVIVDLRAGSPTRLKWYGLELRAHSELGLYVPPGFAHGFITLEDESILEYQISDFYVPQGARGIRYDDPQVGIAWPFAPTVISERDRNLPLVEAADV